MPAPDSDYSRLLQPGVLRSFIGITTLAQSTSDLIAYVLKNPSILIEAYLDINDRETRFHMANAIIPSIFSYYSSEEMLEYATIFYLHCIEVLDSDDIVALAIPFINSGLTMKYIEEVLRVFFQLYTADNQIIDDKSYLLIMSEYAATFIRYCADCLNMLPPSIIRVFKTLVERGWLHKRILHLFFDCFVFPRAKEYGQCLQNRDKIQNLDRIFNLCASCEVENEFLLSAITKVVATMAVPPFRRGDSYDPFEALICVNDMGVLARALETSHLLPPSITVDDFQGYSQGKRFQYFWAAVYTGRPPPPPRIFEGAGDIGEFFDRLLTMKGDVDDLSAFASALSEYSSVLLEPIAARIASGSSRVLDSFFQKQSLFKGDPSRSKFFVSLVRTTVFKLPMRLQQALMSIGRQWAPHVERCNRDLQLPPLQVMMGQMTPAAYDLVAAAVRTLGELDAVGLVRRYSLFRSALLSVEAVVEANGVGDLLYCAVLLAANSETLVPSFIMLNSLAMRTPAMQALVSPTFARVWMKAEATLNLLLSCDVVFLRAVSAVARALNATAVPVSEMRKAVSAPLMQSMGIF